MIYVIEELREIYHRSEGPLKAHFRHRDPRSAFFLSSPVTSMVSPEFISVKALMLCASGQSKAAAIEV
jgi:hypothetical protein